MHRKIKLIQLTDNFLPFSWQCLFSTKDMVRQSVQYANLLEFSFLKICLHQLNESGSTRLYEKDRQSTEICKQRRKYLKRRK